MWLFITARIRQWLIFAVVIPLVSVLVRYLRAALEKRSGETRLTRNLRKLEDFGARGKRSTRRR
ncbi:MAG TPA: hypothetical protein VFP89_11705 [Propionibacteriaceae bacterium]|nr:hypothetical protein [Propionibacteriaceae bacterium]